MIRHSVHKLLRAPWQQRWLADAVALALATLVLPRIGERVKLDTWPGFALVLVATTAILLAASWAVIPPPQTPFAPPNRRKPRQAHAVPSGTAGNRAASADLISK